MFNPPLPLTPIASLKPRQLLLQPTPQERQGNEASNELASIQRFGGYNYAPTAPFWQPPEPETPTTTTAVTPVAIPTPVNNPQNEAVRVPIQARPLLKQDVLERQATAHVAEQTLHVEAAQNQNTLSPTVQRAEAVRQTQVHQQKEAQQQEQQHHDEKQGLQGLSPVTRKENNYKQVAMYASSAMNASIFLGNLANSLGSSTLRRTPQPLSVMGSLINLGSVFLPDPLKLPAFVAGTAMFMGGSSINQTHVDRCDVSRPVKTIEAFDKIATQGRWNSYSMFPHPEYIRNNPVRQTVLDIEKATLLAKQGLDLAPIPAGKTLPTDWAEQVKQQIEQGLAHLADTEAHKAYPAVAPRPTPEVITKLTQAGHALKETLLTGKTATDKQALAEAVDRGFKAVAHLEPERFGFAHLAHPGYLAELAQNKYYDAFYPLVDGIKLGGIRLALPTVAASAMASMTQLSWMTGKMLTDWGFAHDALLPVERQEFIKGTRFTIPNSRGYALALGAMLPLGLLGSAALWQGMHRPKSATPQTELSPKQSLAEQQKRQDDPFSRHKSGSFELVANASSMLPQLANLLMVPIIAKEGIGKPVHIMPMGINRQHAITPRLNAGLIDWGSKGALLTAALATVSDLGVVPRYVAHVSDILFMAFSGLTQIGISRNTFEEEFRISQAYHLFPTPNMFEHMRQYVEAQKNGWLAWWPGNRVPKL
jgi:hypothetical protein